MRVARTVTSIAFFTAMALGYVHQQVELVKLSYVIECKEKTVKDMLDRQEKLRYNIENLEAPSRLEKVLASNKREVSFPKRGNVFEVAQANRQSGYGNSNIRTVGLDKKANILGILEFFSPRAEAHTIKER